ncbi:hypothetical protein D5086_011575 [Populus alba]|uniref:Uncharacterized protein n=1 Tax=Populus alba TaxID=43335 RepID=A0ACC4CE89_POPAL
MSSDSTGVQLGGPKERGNCCSSDYKDHEHQHILSQIAPCNCINVHGVYFHYLKSQLSDVYAWHLKIKMVGKHIVVVLPMRALCAKYQWHGTTEDVVNVQKQGHGRCLL